ncbi:glycosyltransferase family 10 domain-containing protein [Thalassovita taeanensis]|uniref:glycosyltransferase family 10 domain-containing protein n=1 Tax=Thalassovita taeanensis TaxID=657014 RepID=UPI001114D651|nr:glycosyltransferase family 10 [Thalassovita taeanensis]
MTEDPGRADIVAVSHTKDLEIFGAGLRRSLSRDQRLILLSEEPFWDTCWGTSPLERDLVHDTPDGPLPLTQLNHVTSAIYDFDKIPYFPLTSAHFSTRYTRWFSRNSMRSASGWKEHLTSSLGQAVFMMARRKSPRYEVTFPQAGVFSICNQRTAIAEACQGVEMVHLGQGWHDTPPRQGLTDWHLDKFLTLDGGYCFVSAIENTHQYSYVTEKLFDAYAVGAVPLYVAGTPHRVHELALPGTWLNLLDVPFQEIPELMADFAMTPAFFEVYAEQQAGLARLFGDRDILHAELARLSAALFDEFSGVLER